MACENRDCEHDWGTPDVLPNPATHKIFDLRKIPASIDLNRQIEVYKMAMKTENQNEH